MTEPVLITGVPRSGTSVIAGIFHFCGCFGGEVRGANKNNPKGQFENRRMVNLNKSWLVRLDYDPRGQKPVPDTGNIRFPSPPEKRLWRIQVEDILRYEGWDEGSKWYFKDPKTIWNWPVWYSAFPEAKWVIVRRDTEYIARSCLKTGFMNTYRTPESWKKWIQKNLQFLEELKSYTDNWIEVWPEEFMADGNYSTVRRVVEWAGLDWSPEADTFIERRLWNNG